MLSSRCSDGTAACGIQGIRLHEIQGALYDQLFKKQLNIAFTAMQMKRTTDPVEAIAALVTDWRPTGLKTGLDRKRQQDRPTQRERYTGPLVAVRFFLKDDDTKEAGRGRARRYQRND